MSTANTGPLAAVSTKNTCSRIVYCTLMLCWSYCSSTADFQKLRLEVREAAKVCRWWLCVLVSLFVWGVEHGDREMRFTRFKWYGTTLHGQKKNSESLRLKNWRIFDSDLDWKDRPPKPPLQSRDFPYDYNVFRAIQSQSPITEIVTSTHGRYPGPM